MLPTLWFRNTWHDGSEKPSIADGVARHAELGEWRFETDAPLLYCENETGPKAAINDHVVHGAPIDASSGTKCAAHHVLEIPAGGSAEVRVRLIANAGHARLRRGARRAPRGGRRVLREGDPAARSTPTARS